MICLFSAVNTLCIVISVLVPTNVFQRPVRLYWMGRQGEYQKRAGAEFFGKRAELFGKRAELFGKRAEFFGKRAVPELLVKRAELFGKRNPELFGKRSEFFGKR